MQTDEAENLQRVFKKISIRERWVIRIKKEREKKERKNVSGKLNDRERSRVKFRFLSGLRAIRSSGKLEISEFLPIPLSVSLLPEEFLRKAGVWLRACLTAHSFKAEPLFFIICLLPFSIRCSFFFQGWRNGDGRAVVRNIDRFEF